MTTKTIPDQAAITTNALRLTDKQIAESNIGYYFTAFGQRCQVTQVGIFSGVRHYGFVNVDEYRTDSPACGWIPVAFIRGCELTK